MRTALVLTIALSLTACAGEQPLGPVEDMTCAKQYPAATLREWRDRRLSGIWSVDGVTITAYDEAKGCLHVGVSDLGVIPKVEDRLQTISIPRDAVFITIVPKAPVAASRDPMAGRAG